MTQETILKIQKLKPGLLHKNQLDSSSVKQYQLTVPKVADNCWVDSLGLKNSKQPKVARMTEQIKGNLV